MLLVPISIPIIIRLVHLKEYDRDPKLYLDLIYKKLHHTELTLISLA